MNTSSGPNSEPGAPNAKRKVLGDSVITTVERVFSQVSQFVIFVVAARVLGPAEFGVFALVSACAILLLRAAEVGWSPFIMSWRGDSTVPRQVLFLAVLSGVVFAAIGLLASVITGYFGAGAETIRLMDLLSLWVFIATVSSAQKGILIWQSRLKSSAICEISGEAVGLAVAVTALYAGYGVLSLAFGRLAFQSTHLVLSFLITRMSPLPGLKGEVLRELWVFSLQLFASRMLIHIRLYVATFIIGGYLGPAAVGYYRAADRLVSAVAEIIAVPGQLLAWTQFRKARDDGDASGQLDRINSKLRLLLKILTAVGAPIFIWLIFMSDELIHGLLNPEWLPAVPLVAILALSRLLSLFGIVTEPLMSIVGQARQLPIFSGIVFAVSTLLTLFSIQFGLYAVAWAQLGIAALVLLATMWLLRRFVHTPWGEVFKELRGIVLPLICGGATLVLLDVLTDDLGIPYLVQAVGFGLSATVIYLGAIRVFDRAFYAQVSSSWRAETAV